MKKAEENAGRSYTPSLEQISRRREYEAREKRVREQVPHTWNRETEEFFLRLVRRIDSLETQVKNLNKFHNGDLKFGVGRFVMLRQTDEFLLPEDTTYHEGIEH